MSGNFPFGIFPTQLNTCGGSREAAVRGGRSAPATEWEQDGLSCAEMPPAETAQGSSGGLPHY